MTSQDMPHSEEQHTSDQEEPTTTPSAAAETPAEPATAPSALPESSVVRPAKRFTLLHILGVFIVGIIVGGVGGFFGGGLIAGPQRDETTAGAAGAAAGGAGATGDSANLMSAVIDQTRHFKGDPDAPVTIIEFSDFRCPYCGRHSTGAGQQIEEEYVESGVVRVGYYSLAFLSEESLFAAEASECAADQDAFWEYHDLLFERMASSSFSKENLKQFAADLDLDTTTFDECLDSGKYTATIQNQTSAANAIGVRSTPTFLINGQPMMGAQPFENFQNVIESLR